MANCFNILNNSNVELQKKDSANITFSDIKKTGKHIGLYFSAHWCPPCRGFTPVLAEFYKAHGEKLEIIFVSSDRDEAGFNDYYGKEMPWCALPFSNRDMKNELAQDAGVSGIPHFLLLNPDGTVSDKNLQNNARTWVVKDPDWKTS